MSDEVTWIECDGGPHILIDNRYLRIWKGKTDEEFERSCTYYEEAGLIDGHIGELRIAEGKCLIINEEFTASTWISDNDTSGFFAGVNYVSEKYGNEEIKFSTLLKEFHKIPDERFVDMDLSYQVTDSELYLFAACDFGDDWLYDYCKINLQQGNYRIRMVKEYIFEGSSFILYKFSKF